MAKWLFLERRPDRPAGGDAFRRTFGKLDPEVALAREAIQNAVDAAADDEQDSVIVEFELREDCNLSELLGPPFSDHASAESFVDRDLRLPVEEARRRGQVLLIHDVGTTGLTGDMQNMHSNFFRLMGGLGGSEKVGGGGSYGFGKAAAILNSQLFTVFAYTVTNEAKGRSKLWGTSYLDPHRLDKSDYLGVGWYCREGSEDQKPLILEDEEADLIAARLHIRRVQTREVGTTVALIYPSTDMEALEKQVRENWWPRIAERANDADHQLIYIFEDGRRRPISLEGDKRIRPFLDLYGVARGLKKPSKEVRLYELAEPIRSARDRSAKVKLGVLALSYDPSEPDAEDALDGIALVRKPRMVVTYYRYRGFPVGVRGIFIADAGMDGLLRKTEPHEHDDWNEKIPGPSLDKERQYAKLIKFQIRKKVAEFMDTYAPPPEAEPKLLPELRRLLGSLFLTQGTGTPGQGGEPVSITDKSTRVEQAGLKLRLVGRARFTSHAKEPIRVNIGAEVRIVESDLASGGDPLPTIVCVGGKSRGPSDRPFIEWVLNTNESIDLVFETVAFESEWTTRATFWSELVGQ